MKSNDWQVDWGQDEYGILSKLIFSESTVRVSEGILRTLGFVHLYTASGIHLYALLDAIEKLFRWIASFSGVRAVFIKRIGLYLGMILLAYLWYLQSYRVGFARPILIFLIRMWVRERGMKWRLFYPLAITFLIDWVLKIESGRLHYYLAVGGGLLGMDWAKQKKWGGWAEHVAMAFGSWFFTAGVDLAFHHQVAWMTPIWSLITIPLISLVLYPMTLGVLLVTHSIPSWIFETWNRLLSFCVSVADFGFTFSLVTPSAVWISAILAAVATAALLKVKDRRFSAVAILFLAVGAALLSVDDSRVVQLDVQQGDSMLAIKQNRVEMVDVGSARALAPHQWLQKFSEQGVNQVDVILLTHLDEDHVGGLVNLVAWVPISSIQTHSEHWNTEKGERLREKLHARNERLELTSKNQLKLMQLSWFRSTARRRDGNSFMAGIAMPLDDHRVYLGLGDGDDSQEAQYLEFFRETLSHYPIRIWKAGHHGSKHSSGQSEMQALRPSRVWISVGRKNRYHHPSVEAMSRLKSLGIPIQRTDEEGDLVEKISHPS